MEYSLNPHSQELLEQYRKNLPIYQKIEEVALQAIQHVIKELGISLSSMEHRIKTEKSLAGKLELKGGKYASINDITDLFGILFCCSAMANNQLLYQITFRRRKLIQ